LSREFDLVVFGATGFTGRLTIAELCGYEPPGGLKLAIAGRSEARLKDVAAALGRDDIGVIVSDVADPASLAALARRTVAMVTAVGPYALYGRPLVEACIVEKTHCADLTGEPNFVVGLMAECHDRAEQAGVKIVSCCGFDSIPADAGAWFTASQLPAGVPKTVRAYMEASGQPSGGTWASIVEGLASGQPKLPTPRLEGERRTDRLKATRHTAPGGGMAVPLPIIDPWIVRRSSRADVAVYGHDFQYGHFAVVKPLLGLKIGAIFGGAALAAQIPAPRPWLKSLRPSGAGPDEATRSKSWFRIDFHGEGGGRTVRCRVSGGDPGYTETSRMLAACGRMLANAE